MQCPLTLRFRYTMATRFHGRPRVIRTGMDQRDGGDFRRAEKPEWSVGELRRRECLRMYPCHTFAPPAPALPCRRLRIGQLPDGGVSQLEVDPARGVQPRPDRNDVRLNGAIRSAAVFRQDPLRAERPPPTLRRVGGPSAPGPAPSGSLRRVRIPPGGLPTIRGLHWRVARVQALYRFWSCSPPRLGVHLPPGSRAGRATGRREPVAPE